MVPRRILPNNVCTGDMTLLVHIKQLLKLTNRPIEHIVMLETFAAKEAVEQISEELVIGLVLVTQFTKVVDVGSKLRGYPMA
jgi:hypothetical protein